MGRRAGSRPRQRRVVHVAEHAALVLAVMTERQAASDGTAHGWASFVPGPAVGDARHVGTLVRADVACRQYARDPEAYSVAPRRAVSGEGVGHDERTMFTTVPAKKHREPRA